ncbi:MAG: glycosyltransferase [bacterium]
MDTEHRENISGDGQMRIMQIIHYPGQGGAEQYAYLLAKYAKKSGNETCFVFGQKGPLEKRVKELGCETFYLKMRSPFDPLAITGLSRLYKKWKPDVVQTHFLRENFIAIAANKLVPVKAIFSTVHRIEPKTKTQATFNKAYSKGLKKFIAVSELTKDYLVNEGINEHKITMIPNGAEIENFDKNKLKKELGLNPKDIIFSCVARFEPEKNHELLIKAFHKIINRDYKLLLLGEGEQKSKIQKLVQKHKLEEKILLLDDSYIGYQIIGISDYYIQASKVESFGITVVEAMLQQVPVVLSDIPAFKALTKNGDFGTLFRENNVNDLKERVEYVLDHELILEKKTGLACKYVETRYTAQIMWQKTETLYKHYL